MGRNYFIVGFRILHRLQKKWQNYLDYGNAPFIRLLWYSPIFRWSLLASCCVLVTIPFLLMRLWTVTPQHIDPPTRISVLDFIQASALRRSAERATEKSSSSWSEFFGMCGSSKILRTARASWSPPPGSKVRQVLMPISSKCWTWSHCNYWFI